MRGAKSHAGVRSFDMSALKRHKMRQLTRCEFYLWEEIEFKMHPPWNGCARMYAIFRYLRMRDWKTPLGERVCQMGKRVLLIEDEPNIIEAIRFILSRDGWTVETHSDGATAVAAVAAKRPDIVILDVMLPNKSGFDILRDLRGMAEHSELSILMLTARGQKKDRDMAEAAGVSHFMTKPFSNSEMLEAVRRLAGLDRAQANDG